MLTRVIVSTYKNPELGCPKFTKDQVKLFLTGALMYL